MGPWIRGGAKLAEAFRLENIACSRGAELAGFPGGGVSLAPGSRSGILACSFSYALRKIRNANCLWNVKSISVLACFDPFATFAVGMKLALFSKH